MPIPAYSAIADSEIDPNSPITEALLTKLRDNPISIAGAGAGAPQIAAGAIGALSATQLASNAVTTIKIQSNAVTEAKIAASAVSQSKLKTGTSGHTFSSVAGGGGTSAQQFATVGSYGFYPQVTAPTGNFSVFIANGISSATLVTNVSVRNDHGSAQDIGVQFRYVQASPPYDLGDGDVPLFVFIGMVGKKISGISVCEDPPWAGADIVPHSHRNGKGYRMVRDMPCSPAEAIKSPAKLEAYLDALKNAPLREVEITTEYKNRGMHKLPHTMIGVESVILLDPVSSMVRDLAQMHREGEDVGALISSGLIEFDSQPIKRCAPFGVIPVTLRWKNSK